MKSDVLSILQFQTVGVLGQPIQGRNVDNDGWMSSIAVPWSYPCKSREDFQWWSRWLSKTAMILLGWNKMGKIAQIVDRGLSQSDLVNNDLCRMFAAKPLCLPVSPLTGGAVLWSAGDWSTGRIAGDVLDRKFMVLFKNNSVLDNDLERLSVAENEKRSVTHAFGSAQGELQVVSGAMRKVEIPLNVSYQHQQCW